MRTEDVSVPLTATEKEIILAALAFFDLTFCKDPPEERLIDTMRALRAKLTGHQSRKGRVVRDTSCA